MRALLAARPADGTSGATFLTERAKTGAPVGGAISDRAMAVLAAYIGELGAELHGAAYIFRNRSGRP